MATPTTSSAASASNGQPAFEDIQTEVLSAFTGDIEPVRVPITYRLGILLVTEVMVLLPLLYIGIIGLVAYGVYYHAINHVGMLESGRGRGKIMVFLAYLAPMIVGGILVLFMFKPLFSRPAKGRKLRSLSRDKEPLLFAFVDRICVAVGSAKPKRIDVDCQVNASASFRKGIWSMFGNDLVLTIGMPLVAGLSAREFAGVLAHEFGHFAQGAGMRLTYIIRSISFWFTRVVYERDEWDERLVGWSEGADLRIGWVLYLARLFVWMTRKILWVLMQVGHMVSGYMLRQMEFDADRHEARLAGSDAFESTARKLTVLAYADRNANSDLSEFYSEGRLGDDYPRLVMHNVQQFPADALQKMNAMVDESETGWLDTHPCDRDRIANARQEDAAGIFTLEKPASIVFRDFHKTSQEATLEIYRGYLGDDFNTDTVHDLDDLLARQNVTQETFQALHRCFQGSYRTDRLLLFPVWKLGPPKDVKKTLSQVKPLRQGVLDGVAAYREACDRYDEVPAEEESQVTPDMVPFEKVAAQRVIVSLALLHVPAVAKKVEQAEAWQQECAHLMLVCKQLNDQLEEVDKLARMNNYYNGLLERWVQDQDNEKLTGVVIEQTEISAQKLEEVRDPLLEIDYPFDHAEDDISIGKYSVERFPHRKNPGEVQSACESMVSSFNHVRARIVGRFCLIAEGVEAALGLEPLPEPKAAESQEQVEPAAAE